MRHSGCSTAGKMRGTLVLGLIICFIHLSVSTLSPRGPRPTEFGHLRSSSCSEQNKWPICTDDDLGPKCPSGCRMQGLIDVKNQENDERVRDIRRLLEEYSKMFGNTHITVTEAINRIRQSLDGLGRFGDNYYQQVDHLNSRLTILQNRINEQINKINRLRNTILEQFNEITRLEVDIDIKIRACKGSCKKSFIYNIDRERNAQLAKNLMSMTSFRIERIEYGKPTHTFKIRLLKGVTNTNYKTADIGDTYPHFWDDTNVREFSLETNTEVSSGIESKGLISYDPAVSATPQSGVKILTDTRGTSSTSRHVITHSSGKTLTDGSGTSSTSRYVTTHSSGKTLTDGSGTSSTSRYVTTHSSGKTLTDGRGTSGTSRHVTTHSSGKTLTDADVEHSILRGDGIYSSELHHFADNLDEKSHVPNRHFTQSSQLKTSTSHGSVTTKTIISKDGRVTETVTVGAPDFLSSPVEHSFGELGIPLNTKTATSTSTHHSPDFESLRTSGTKSTASKVGSRVVHRITSTSDSGDFSNLGDFTDFGTADSREPGVRVDGLSSSTRTVIHETQRWSKEGGSKGFRSSHDVNVHNLPDEETQASHMLQSEQ
ncbi:fibrinogen alpha chain-like [Pristis pectinata]|uniref:fibrinogen alpha chain-like n=1 Tax=Pristis pectinata TaxID=685728 RepID=UPI00223CAE4E|nr:fibrinogen alpha chain-like [Pristis pectinata]